MADRQPGSFAGSMHHGLHVGEMQQQTQRGGISQSPRCSVGPLLKGYWVVQGTSAQPQLPTTAQLGTVRNQGPSPVRQTNLPRQSASGCCAARGQALPRLASCPRAAIATRARVCQGVQLAGRWMRVVSCPCLEVQHVCAQQAPPPALLVEHKGCCCADCRTGTPLGTRNLLCAGSRQAGPSKQKVGWPWPRTTKMQA